jgi:hypothetical protein
VGAATPAFVPRARVQLMGKDTNPHTFGLSTWLTRRHDVETNEFPQLYTHAVLSYIE